jgi:hypothetical protein
MSNENCLAGMRCPECKSDGPFQIAGTATFLVFDDGTDDYFDPEWDAESACQCRECKHIGTVKDFQIEDEDESKGESNG